MLKKKRGKCNKINVILYYPIGRGVLVTIEKIVGNLIKRDKNVEKNEKDTFSICPNDTATID
ncbi:hypothetical protein T07_223 [Trichinella nelsoni]|uniref:Uncharacterized protein n=1 Tax=Trichinella nelsoni TaxID=6336 RepID=A0A0V0RT64_9BILA|nr:hypothetical protein T07_223 [Trichinella nelsoni]